MTHMTEDEFQAACMAVGEKFAHLDETALEHLAGACLFKHQGSMTTLSFVSSACPLCDGSGCSYSQRRRSMLLIEVDKLVGRKHTINYRPTRECSRHAEGAHQRASGYPPAFGKYLRLAVMRLDDNGLEQNQLHRRMHRPCALCRRDERSPSTPREAIALPPAAISQEEAHQHIERLSEDADRKVKYQVTRASRESDEDIKALQSLLVIKGRQIKELQESSASLSQKIAQQKRKVAVRDAKISKLQGELSNVKESLRNDGNEKVRGLRAKIKELTTSNARYIARYNTLKTDSQAEITRLSKQVKTARAEGISEGKDRGRRANDTTVANNKALRAQISTYEAREKVLLKAVEELRVEVYNRRCVDPLNENPGQAFPNDFSENDDIVSKGIDCRLLNLVEK